jgi:ISXO2 transposase-like protein
MSQVLAHCGPVIFSSFGAPVYPRTVNHSAQEYVSGDRHVNTLEGYFSILKRSIRSTHTWVSEKHMPNYLAEFEYRMNLRKTPRLMFALMLSFKRLVPKPVPVEPIPF